MPHSWLYKIIQGERKPVHNTKSIANRSFTPALIEEIIEYFKNKDYTFVDPNTLE
jgi:hypothetical protein